MEVKGFFRCHFELMLAHTAVLATPPLVCSKERLPKFFFFGTPTTQTHQKLAKQSELRSEDHNPVSSGNICKVTYSMRKKTQQHYFASYIECISASSLISPHTKHFFQLLANPWLQLVRKYNSQILGPTVVTPSSQSLSLLSPDLASASFVPMFGNVKDRK